MLRDNYSALTNFSAHKSFMIDSSFVYSLLESIFMDLLLFMLILNKDLTSFLLDHVIKRQQ